MSNDNSDARKHISWDEHYGKTFKITHTPKGAQSVGRWNKGLVSIVTPENGKAWTDWKEIHPDKLAGWKKNWNERQTTLGQHKHDQIMRSHARLTQGTSSMKETKAQSLLSMLESWRDAEKFHQVYAAKNDPISHHYNKLLSQHMDMANGKDRKTRGRAKEVLRHFVKWQEAETDHKDKHKKFPTMDDLAAQKPAALKAWAHYKRTVGPKERRYHKAMWLLTQETELAKKMKGKGTK